MVIPAFFISLFGLTSAHWSYKSGNGTHDWHGECAQGRQQSPIDIANAKVTKVYDIKPLIFEHFDELPELETITNNGHSVTFTLEEPEGEQFPKIIGGGLPGVFQFSQFHFHWGSRDAQGSEHTLNGKKAPMELHLVFFNTAYGSNISDAVQNSNNAWDTLAVLGVLFQIQNADNHNFDSIVQELKFVKFLDQEINVTVFPLKKVLPSDTRNFYRYNGSLTTPPCSEIVIWTMFKAPVMISEEQLNIFRDIVDVDPTSPIVESESDNFRDTQPLNRRRLLDVHTPPSKASSLTSAATSRLGLILMTVILFIHN